MFRSIRWTLQVWHAGLLACVLIGFGVALVFWISQEQQRRVDEGLEKALRTVSVGMMPLPPGRGGQNEWPVAVPRARPREREEGGRPGMGRVDLGFERRGPGRMPWGFGRPPGEPQLQQAVAQMFRDGQDGSTYYVVWNSKREISESSLEQASELPVPIPEGLTASGRMPDLSVRYRQRDDRREAYSEGPFGYVVLVGRSMKPEWEELERIAWLIFLTGVAVLGAGLAGGWILSRKVVRSIDEVTKVAQDISAQNLSQRIDSERAPREFAGVAKVLNDTFSRLEASFNQQRQFTADASHELRTPLAIIQSQAQVVLSRERSPEEYRSALKACLRAAGRMTDMVESLLLLASVESKGHDLKFQIVDLSFLIEDCLESVEPLARERGIKIESRLDSVFVWADPTWLSQAIINLLTNAIRYNRPDGTVRIESLVEEGNVCVNVTDTGVGIAPEHLEQVFNRFYRVDGARSRDGGGSGLGLAICRALVEAQSGKVRASSEPGKGSIFTVVLPVFVCEGAAA
jgi:two-component system, OmpR family, sensor kinase